jgi:hypothetical protein
MDYFGLRYYDEKEQPHWLDADKSIKKQQKRVKKGPYTFFFQVKLFPLHPSFLFEEVTRYFVSLQIRRDVMEGIIPCSEETQAILAGYIVQGEFGDFDPSEHTQGYLDDYPFLQDKTTEFIDRVIDNHKKNKGLTPGHCDKRFLDVAYRLPLYGIDLHTVMDYQGIPLYLGISGNGITVYCGELPALVQLNNFPWVKVSAIKYKSKNLVLDMISDPQQEYDESIIFQVHNRTACKELWKASVEHHSFFRSIKSDKRPKSTNYLFRRGSTFRYSGRTQLRLLEDGVRNSTMNRRSGSKKFERLTSSHRHSNRGFHRTM